MKDTQICYHITKSDQDDVFFVKKGTKDEKSLRRKGLRDLCLNCFHKTSARSSTPCEIHSTCPEYAAYGSIIKNVKSMDILLN